MKLFKITCIILIFIVSCKSYDSKQIINNSSSEIALVENDTVSISSSEYNYEIIIIEPGFNAWLESRARPRHYYSQEFLENRNAIYVQSWNSRTSPPTVYDQNLYQLRIDYDRRTDYGYEINYKLYNYFIYFQLTYNQKLGPFLPRI